MPRAVKYIARALKPGGLGYTYTYPKGYSRAAGKAGALVPGTGARSNAGSSISRSSRPVRSALTHRNGYTLTREPFQRQGTYEQGWKKFNLRHEGFHLTTSRPTNSYYGASQIHSTRRSITVRLTGNASGRPVVYSKTRPARGPQKHPFEKSYGGSREQPHQVLKAYNNPTGSSLRRLDRLYDRGAPNGRYGL